MKNYAPGVIALNGEMIKKRGYKMYAILETGGKQYRVAEGESCRVERLPAEVGTEISFDRVLVVGEGDNLLVGSPVVAGASVKALVKSHGKGRKIIVYKYKAKKNYRRKQGHRQPYTELYIKKIEAGSNGETGSNGKE